MSCESNSNKAGVSAAVSGGVPKTSGKVANFFGKVTGVNFIMRKIEEAKVADKARREKEAEARRQAAKRRTVLVKDPERQQAAAAVQKKYLDTYIPFGKTPGEEDFANIVGAINSAERLTDQTYRISGSRGEIVVDYMGGGMCQIHAIAPKLGQEIALRNALAAYTTATPPAESNDKSGRGNGSGRRSESLRDAEKWVTDHQEEIQVLTDKYLRPATQQLINGRSVFSNPMQDYWYEVFNGEVYQPTAVEKINAATAMVNGMYQDVQRVQRKKRDAGAMAEAIKQPERKKAAIELQTKYATARVSRQNLEGLMGDGAKNIAGHVWQVDGPLGRLYFETQGDDCQIHGITPRLGGEIQLRNGLASLVPARKAKE